MLILPCLLMYGGDVNRSFRRSKLKTASEVEFSGMPVKKVWELSMMLSNEYPVSCLHDDPFPKESVLSFAIAAETEKQSMNKNKNNRIINKYLVNALL